MAQAEVMRLFLTTPLHSLDERTPRTAVWDERQESWAQRPGCPFRQALVGNVRERIRAMPDAPARIRDHFLPGGGRVVLTKRGQRAVSDSAALWERVAGALAAAEDFVCAIRELLLVKLLKGPGKRGVIEAAILPVLAEAGWKPSDEPDLDQDIVSFNLWDAIRPIDLLGMIEVGDWPDRGLRLTDFGSVTARAILCHCSTAPRQSIT